MKPKPELAKAVPDRRVPGRNYCGGQAVTYEKNYLRCLLTNLVISNIVTCFFPPKRGLSLSSALMLVLFFWSWSEFFLIYCQSFFVTSVRGIALEPTTCESASSGCMGFIKAAF